MCGYHQRQEHNHVETILPSENTKTRYPLFADLMYIPEDYPVCKLNSNAISSIHLLLRFRLPCTIARKRKSKHGIWKLCTPPHYYGVFLVKILQP